MTVATTNIEEKVIVTGATLAYYLAMERYSTPRQTPPRSKRPSNDHRPLNAYRGNKRLKAAQSDLIWSNNQ